MNQKEMLNEWASTFMNEGTLERADAVSTEWYTSFPSSAFVVLMEMARDGSEVEIEMKGNTVTVSCGGYEESGSMENLAMVMLLAAYNHANASDT